MKAIQALKSESWSRDRDFFFSNQQTCKSPVLERALVNTPLAQPVTSNGKPI
jgi:hypothetical protein